MRSDGFIGRVSPADADSVYGLTVTFACLFGTLYSGASLLSGYVPWRIHVDFPVEARLPFVPEAALLYLTVVPFLCLAPFVLRERSRIARLFHALTVSTCVGACVFVLLPVEPRHAIAPAHADASLPFRIADWINLERNEFPSLHVALVTTAMLAYLARARSSIALSLVIAWAVAIISSPVLTREHSLADVAAGLALGAFSWRFAGARAHRSSWLAALNIELLCLANFARFSRRHVRYLVIAVALLWKSLPAFRQRRILRTGFAFLQSVDDLLDGDRRSDREPLAVTEGLLVALRDNAFAEDDLSRLAGAFRADLIAAGGTAALGKAMNLMHTMQRDRLRVIERTLLDEAQLRGHHRDTFTDSVDLMLLAAGARLRSSDVPELIDAFGWCSTVRDLDEDLRHGLINIPKSIVELARRERPDIALHELGTTEPVRTWLATGATSAHEWLDRTDERLMSLREDPGAAILRMFSRSIRRYAVRWSDPAARVPHPVRK